MIEIIEKNQKDLRKIEDWVGWGEGGVGDEVEGREGREAGKREADS